MDHDTKKENKRREHKLNKHVIVTVIKASSWPCEENTSHLATRKTDR